jgi:hypothetical protein
MTLRLSDLALQMGRKHLDSQKTIGRRQCDESDGDG